MELREISEDMLKEWLHKFENGGSEYLPANAKSKTRAGDSPTTVNTLISFFTHIFDIGVKAKILRRNPARALKRMPPSQKVMDLPNRTQWAAMVAHIRKGAGWGTKTADLVEGLAYSGIRIGEGRSLEWGHIDWERNQFVIYPEKSRPRTNPMVDDFRNLLLRIKGDRQPSPAEKVFQCQEATMSLAKASALVGKPKMTHHDLRHLFATNCIEQGVDIPTLSKWLGHRDGGALAMRTYINVRTDHGVQAAKKVSFK
jgi:integrase